MTVQADTFLPSVFSLDSANVQAVESSATNPKVRLDSTGFFLTDAAGNKIVQIVPGGFRILSGVTGVAPGLDRIIEWLDQTDGHEIGRIAAWEQSIGANVIAVKSGNPTATRASVSVYGDLANTGAIASIDLQSDASGGVNSRVNMNVGTNTTRIIDGGGNSQFLKNAMQTIPGMNTQKIGGWIHANGSIAVGRGFIVVNFATGSYQIVHAAPFGSPAGMGIAASPLASVIVSSGHVLTHTWIYLDQFQSQIAFADTGTGVPFNTDFAFELTFWQ